MSKRMRNLVVGGLCVIVAVVIVIVVMVFISRETVRSTNARIAAIEVRLWPGGDVAEAIDNAATAKNKAETAASDAKSAKTAAETAMDDAALAKSSAETAKTGVDSALKKIDTISSTVAIDRVYVDLLVKEIADTKLDKSAVTETVLALVSGAVILPQTQVIQPENAFQPVTPTLTAAFPRAAAVISIEPVMTKTMNTWLISYYAGATSQMKAWEFYDPLPMAWTVFPNVTNKVGSKTYPVSRGLEYGEDKDFTGESDAQTYFVVSARHYRIYSGDYEIPALGDKWFSDGKIGSAIMVVNVGETVEFKSFLKRGFTIRGRYWDGNHLSEAIWAGLSHTAFNMLNLSSDSVNAGANCSSPDGCGKVRLTFVIVSGSEVLMKGTCFVSR